MGKPVVGLVIQANGGLPPKLIQLMEDGHPARVSSWSIESDWLYVVYNGQRRAYRLESLDFEIREVLGEPEEKRDRRGVHVT